MKYDVQIIQEAEEDIFDIYRYVLLNDSMQKADYVFDKLRQTCESLAEVPERGHIPPELERVGVVEYREIHFKPYRVIYQVSGKRAFIHCVVDGRRDLQELLERRLLR
jgi:toxin ParE1/3/4